MVTSTATGVGREPPAGAGGEVGLPSAVSRRLAAGALDTLLLSAGLLLVIGTELAIAAEEAVAWVAVGWTLLFAPLYFALYHAFGTGATPGELELRIGLRDVRSGALPRLPRAVARAYLGFLFLVLVVPALVDLAALATGRSLRDRITRTASVGIALEGKAPELAGPTVAELVPIFEPPEGTRRYLLRGWWLLRARPRLVLGPVIAVYAVLLTIAAVVSVLLTDSVDEFTAGAFAVFATLLFVSGMFWTKAVVAVAAQEIRVGSEEASVWGTLVRASRRVNALSAALVPLLLVTVLGAATVWALLAVVARLTLVAPALVLEDTRVIGAFRRSWQLARGQTWELLGLLLLSYLTVGVVVFAAGEVTAPISSGGSAVAVVAGGCLTAGALVVPVAWLGVAWSLVYEDSRRRLPPGAREGGQDPPRQDHSRVDPPMADEVTVYRLGKR
jgi:hypothetical protein